MGIPLVWEPSTGRNTNDKNNADAKPKTDPAAERHHRSSIRRFSNRSRRSPHAHISRAVGPVAARYPAPQSPLSREEPWSSRASAERETGARGRDRDRDARSPMDNPMSAGSPVTYFGDFPRVHDLAYTGGISSSRRDIGQQILRDSLRHASPGRRLRVRRDPSIRPDATDALGPPPPPPRDWPNHPAAPEPSGPAPEPTRSRSATRVSFTPRFAPAHPVDGAGDDQASASDREAGRAPDDRADRTDVDMPLLRRVGHRSVTDANDRLLHPHALIDGLGDRERSFGPDDPNGDGADEDEDDEMHDTWETLLTTIQPDEQLPSAGSSFDSATATASSALSRGSGLTNSVNSSTSSRTAPSSLFSFGPYAAVDAALDCPNPFHFISSDEEFDTEPESDQERDRNTDTNQVARNHPSNDRSGRDTRRSRPRTTRQDSQAASLRQRLMRMRGEERREQQSQDSQQPSPRPSFREEVGLLEQLNRQRMERPSQQTPSFHDELRVLERMNRRRLRADAHDRRMLLTQEQQQQQPSPQRSHPHPHPHLEQTYTENGNPPSESQSQSQPQQPSRIPRYLEDLRTLQRLAPENLLPELLQQSGPLPPSQQRQNDRQGELDAESSFSSAGGVDNLAPELQYMHDILDRLARRDDIPDEWWETAGLSRTIRRELNNDDANRSGEGGD